MSHRDLSVRRLHEYLHRRRGPMAFNHRPLAKTMSKSRSQKAPAPAQKTQWAAKLFTAARRAQAAAVVAPAAMLPFARTVAAGSLAPVERTIRKVLVSASAWPV